MGDGLPTKKFLALILCGALATAAVLLLVLFLATGEPMVVLCGAAVAAVFLVWGGIFLSSFQRRLVRFVDGLCRMLDDMMDGTFRPEAGCDDESLAARVGHRLERLYSALRNSRNSVAEEKAELQTLLSDISHQTKTPIANLKLINETMLTRPMTEEQRDEFLHAAASQLDKMDFLIQALVKTSRLETGAIILSTKNALVEDTLIAAVNGVLAAVEKKGIALSVDCPEGLTAPHDAKWTSEALFNLLDNAVKYTPPGGRIAVTARAWEMYLRIDVADTGRGIPEQEQAAVFKRFYREEAVHDEDGVGIGLYLAREIVSMQGGYITVASAVGAGSTFSVFLPLR